VRLALAALAALQRASGPLSGAGVIVGTPLATLETNAIFAGRIRERGARAAEPRRFPYTSPNAVAGECSIAFGLTGPSFSVGGGMHAALEALAAASVLVEGGDADRIAVVAVDDVGPATLALGGGLSLRAGAVAVLVSARPDGGARARIGAIELRRGDPATATHPAGHLALHPLLERIVPSELVGSSRPDGMARVVLHPV
jgi:3-oxoacyl-[acyl-carrier-protein] synthase-1/3-oxoacyl-[acyl-carrier-protein] synthase II